MNIGQRRLVCGLVKLGTEKKSSNENSVVYNACTNQAKSVGLKGKKETIKDKINKLFNFGKTSSSSKCPSEVKTESDDDHFQPMPVYRIMNKG